MNAAVVLAYRAGEPSRAHAYRLARQFWVEAPVPFLVAGGERTGRAFNVGQAKNAGVRLLQPGVDTLILADADTIPRSYSQVAEAAWQAFASRGLVYCADAIRCLTEVETETCGYWRDALERRGDGGRETDSMSGLLAIDRTMFELLGGFDAGYVGYGFEDLDFRRRAHRQCDISAVRGEAIHLWHRPDPDKDPASPLFRANERRWLDTLVAG